MEIQRTEKRFNLGSAMSNDSVGFCSADLVLSYSVFSPASSLFNAKYQAGGSV